VKAINPKGWPPPRGYSNAMMAENGVLFVAGQIGWDARLARNECAARALPGQHSASEGKFR